jgi:hypothetical protein
MKTCTPKISASDPAFLLNAGPDPDPYQNVKDPDSDPAPDPALFVSGFQMSTSTKNNFIFLSFFLRYIYMITSFFKDKKSQNSK